MRIYDIRHDFNSYSFLVTIQITPEFIEELGRSEQSGLVALEFLRDFFEGLKGLPNLSSRRQVYTNPYNPKGGNWFP